MAVVVGGVDFDLSYVEAVLDRWWGIAAMCANPLTERELIALARAGVDTGWYAREDDRWVQL